MAIHLSSISATFFVNLLNRLGVKPPPPDGFDLINTVQPVSIVDTDLVLPVSSSTALLDLPFTQGTLAAPVATTLLADTGAQAGGSFQATIQVGIDIGGAGGGSPIEVARRNAANNADLWVMRFILGNASAAVPSTLFSGRFNLGVNERIIVRVGGQNFIAGQNVIANIWLSAG